MYECVYSRVKRRQLRLENNFIIVLAFRIGVI